MSHLTGSQMDSGIYGHVTVHGRPDPAWIYSWQTDRKSALMKDFTKINCLLVDITSWPNQLHHYKAHGAPYVLVHLMSGKVYKLSTSTDPKFTAPTLTASRQGDWLREPNVWRVNCWALQFWYKGFDGFQGVNGSKIYWKKNIELNSLFRCFIFVSLVSEPMPYSTVCLM